jgi:glycine cleavage system H protein
MPEYIETTVDKFIFRVAVDRLYSADGIWVQQSGQNNRVRLGLSDYFQQRAGDAAFVHVKPAGKKIEVGDAFAELETIKANSDLYSPLRGVISNVNQTVEKTPEIINQDPYGKGWIAEIDADDWRADRIKLLAPQEYLSAMQVQAEQELSDS